MEIIHLIWEGPFNLADAKNLRGESDFGIYQIYGSHSITGAGTLLYIGKADMITFGGRITAHESEWIIWEPSEVQIYVGRVSTKDGKVSSDKEWGEIIDRAEAVAIYYMSPSYNCARVSTLAYRATQIIVVNHRKRGRLPYCLSNIGEIDYPKKDGLKEVTSTSHPEPVPGSTSDDVKRR